MGELKKLFIDKLNNDDLFSADKALSKEGQELRKNTNISQIVNESIDGTVIQIKNKKKKETLTTYEIDLIYNGIYMKVNLLEKTTDKQPLYKLNIIECETSLTKEEQDEILIFIVKN